MLLWLSAGLNMGLAGKIEILGSGPDFLLLSLAVLTCFTSRLGGAVLGFACGVFYGSLAGANLAQYAISRTLVGFASGWFNDLGFERNWYMVALRAASVVLTAQALLMLSAPPADLPGFLGDTIGSAMYNGVLAVPYFALLRSLLDPKARKFA